MTRPDSIPPAHRELCTVMDDSDLDGCGLGWGCREAACEHLNSPLPLRDIRDPRAAPPEAASPCSASLRPGPLS